jgi:HAE1 family hydrophobic/amphiphilic exporter-1
MQAAQDLNVGGRTTRTQYQYTLQDSDINELNEWAPRLLTELQKLPMLRDVASDQQTSSGMVALTIDRDQARASAFSRPPSIRRSTTLSASVRPHSSSPRQTAITWCWRSRRSCNGIRRRSRSST